MNYELFTAFVLITIILILTPGPVVTLVIATGASHGIRAGLTTVLGTTVGNAILLALIATGLNWVLNNAVAVFEILRWAGAAYLIWLGIQAWRGAGKALDVPPPRRRVHFGRGVVVALTNPKTIAFFTAFLPQFIDPTLPAGRQLFVMCAVSVLVAWIIDSWLGGGRGHGAGVLPQSRRGRVSSPACRAWR
ncbi:MAG: LysE family translocator [Xanthobacteraceae bacterium]|nr:LysE family translocator [Xanthobacteraceae bacterium]